MRQPRHGERGHAETLRRFCQLFALTVAVACWRGAHRASSAHTRLPQPAPPAPAAPSASGLQLDAMDRTADACTDFYQFACGAWMAKNPMPADRSSWGRFDELQERNNETLRKILDAAAAGRDPASKKIGDYYASCMDETAINAKGAAPLDPLLKKIAALTSVNGAGAARRRAAHDRREPVLHLRRRSRLQGRVGRDGDCRPGRPRPARPRLLLPRRCQVGGAAEAVRRAHRQDGGAARRRRRTGRPPRPQPGDEDRDGAREGGARRRLAPRPEQDLPQALASPSCRR